MKLAYPFGTEETKAPVLGYRGNPEEVFPILKDLGYTAIEPFVRDPNLFNTKLFEKIVAASGLEIAAIGTGPVVSDDKLSFTAAEKSVRTAAIKRAKDIFDFASLFDSQINVGKLRGNIDSERPAQSWEWMREAFEQICEYGDRFGLSVTLEPQNIHVVNNLNSTMEAFDFVKKLNLPNLSLMLGVYHMNFEEKSITENFIEAKDHFNHVHFADSNRLAPGKGDLNFKEIISTLQDIKYQNYITLEISQESSSFEEAKAAIDYLKQFYGGGM